jgi:hypothetical protein
MPPNADRRYLDASEMDMVLTSTVDGSGLIVIGSRVVKVPPQGPAHNLVKQVARFLATQGIGDEGGAAALRCNVLAGIIGTVADLHAGPEAIPSLDSTP